MPPPIGVVVRVHHRMQDLVECLQWVRQDWVQHSYYIATVSNGLSSGYSLPAEAHTLSDTTIELPENAGHLAGNSQLIAAGLAALPPEIEWVVLLEADTWLLTDELISQLLAKAGHTGALWASSAWLRRSWTLGLDFALFHRSVLQQVPTMLTFNPGEAPEGKVAGLLLQAGIRFLTIPQLEPVHPPRSLRSWVPEGIWVQEGRFRVFPDAPMLTHHVELLPGGMDTKRELAQLLISPGAAGAALRRQGRRWLRLARLMPQSAWVKAKRVSW